MKNISNAGTSGTNIRALHGGYKVISRNMWHPEGGNSVGMLDSQICTNPLTPCPCRWSMWVTSPLEHPLRNSRLFLTQAHLTCGCPPPFAQAQAVVSTDTPYPDHLSLVLPPCFAPLAPDDTYLFCLQPHKFCSDIMSLPPTGIPIKPSALSTVVGAWRELLGVTPFG